MQTPTASESKGAAARPAWQGMNWIRQEKRLAIYIRDGFMCLYCGTDLRSGEPGQLTLDHLVPRSEAREGKITLARGKVTVSVNHEVNLVTACARCNYSRQAKSWRRFAPGGAVARILRHVGLPLNLELAKAILNGTVGDPRAEAQR